MENLFSTSKQSLVIRPKTVTIAAFHYKGFADLKNLIDFVGSTPKISVEKDQPVLTFKKSVIRDNTIILRDAFGNVTSILSYEEANEIYDIAGQSDFKPEHKNKVVEVVKEKKDKKVK